jgi:alkyl sulfatase BDS1-like metallo-beta-lactamase superfamily hydrolase
MTGREDEMSVDPLFEQLWSGAAPMEAWTQVVSHGAVTEVGADIATVHSTYFCGSVTAIRTTAGLVVIDTANAALATQTLAAIRRWDQSPVHTVIYTHGHVDHTGGIGVIDAEAAARGVTRPRIVAHRAVRRRMERYKATQGFNSLVQGQQFNTPGYVYPVGQRQPDEVYDDTLTLEIGGVRLELMHGRGETDDATFVWLPERRVLASGDFVIWMFPNAGNPRKVQRYAAEWGATLRRMQALRPEVLIPGHGPVVFGAARVAQMLEDGAALLESLVGQALALMNQGCTLDEVLRGVTAPAELLGKPYLRPQYDDPEFVVRAIWHLYGGWFDGDAAHLKLAAAGELAAELAALAGGAGRLAERAAALAEGGRTRLAAHLAELAGRAAPEDAAVQAIRATVLERCMAQETSLMGRAFLGVYQREAKARSGG